MHTNTHTHTPHAVRTRLCGWGRRARAAPRLRGVPGTWGAPGGAWAGPGVTRQASSRPGRLRAARSGRRARRSRCGERPAGSARPAPQSRVLGRSGAGRSYGRGAWCPREDPGPGARPAGVSGSGREGAAGGAPGRLLSAGLARPAAPGRGRSPFNRFDAGWFNFVDKSVLWGWGRDGGGYRGEWGREGCCFFADLFLTRGCTSP